MPAADGCSAAVRARPLTSQRLKRRQRCCRRSSATMWCHGRLGPAVDHRPRCGAMSALLPLGSGGMLWLILVYCGMSVVIANMFWHDGMLWLILFYYGITVVIINLVWHTSTSSLYLVCGLDRGCCCRRPSRSPSSQSNARSRSILHCHIILVIMAY